MKSSEAFLDSLDMELARELYFIDEVLVEAAAKIDRLAEAIDALQAAALDVPPPLRQKIAAAVYLAEDARRVIRILMPEDYQLPPFAVPAALAGQGGSPHA